MNTINEDLGMSHHSSLSSCSLRLLQSRSTGGSFYVNRAEGIDDRVKEVNKLNASTFQAKDR